MKNVVKKRAFRIFHVTVSSTKEGGYVTYSQVFPLSIVNPSSLGPNKLPVIPGH